MVYSKEYRCCLIRVFWVEAVHDRKPKMMMHGKNLEGRDAMFGTSGAELVAYTSAERNSTISEERNW